MAMLQIVTSFTDDSSGIIYVYSAGQWSNKLECLSAVISAIIYYLQARPESTWMEHHIFNGILALLAHIPTGQKFLSRKTI
jgi:hypothetical protein